LQSYFVKWYIFNAKPKTFYDYDDEFWGFHKHNNKK
jgi:hypothetical protein